MKKAEDRLQPALDAVAGFFAALAEPARLRVLHALCGGECTVGAIVEETGLSQPAVSRHLAALHRHGIAARRRDGNQVYYRIADESAPELCRMVCGRLAASIDDRRPLRRGLSRVFG